MDYKKSNEKTKIQRLNSFFDKNKQPVNIDNSKVIYSTNNQDDRDKVLQSKRQNAFLSKAFKRAGYDNALLKSQNYTNLTLMYRDAELMDGFPEIGAALDIVAEESTVTNKENKILNISSSSDRIRNELDNLFNNILDIHANLPMISRATCKYGNEFRLLDIDSEEGVMGWLQLPVHEMQRIEVNTNSNIQQSLTSSFNANISNQSNLKEKFIRTGYNDTLPYESWQVAHFRLLTDSLYLPYGVSWLNKARRHWRMLSSMEDMMLLYRLERSIERKVFKINVGAIDESDVEAYVNEIANNFKRSPIFDSETGQIDLRKNFMDVSQDYFIPVRDVNDSNSIETLASAQNITSMDDIEYMQRKVLTALRIPKSFLNFEEKTGEGQNLSIMDIRFSRTVNKVQQALLMELNKIAIIHLYLKGYEDDIDDFELSLNNPSPQMEMLELENLEKRLRTAQLAVSDPGNGIPLYSWSKTQKEILNMSDNDISELLNELRVEQAISGELEKTMDIIKKTGLFDRSDRIYGEINAEYIEEVPEGMDENDLGGDFNDNLGMGLSDDFEGDFNDDSLNDNTDLNDNNDLNNNDTFENKTKKQGDLIVEKDMISPINMYIKKLTKKNIKINRNFSYPKSNILSENIKTVLDEINNVK